MILSPEVLTIFILNILFLLFASIAFVLSLKIFFKWNSDATTTLQYNLEKQSILSATIIKYIFIIKLPLFLFFIFTLDKISLSITGAMCAAGVVDATPYGTYLFVIKIINIYVFGFWLAFHYLDIKQEESPYTQQKFGLFIIAFILLFAEIVLETLMFYSIDISKMVSCCGTLYSSTTASYISTIFLIKTPLLLSLFYGTFIFIYLFYIFKQKHLFAIFNLLFLIIALISLISFFGTYIYQLPTHHCPFCFLQKDYYYVGYLIYTVLFVGTFYGIIVGFKNEQDPRNYKISLIFNFFYIIIVSLYPIIFYINNGVWL